MKKKEKCQDPSNVDSPPRGVCEPNSVEYTMKYAMYAELWIYLCGNVSNNSKRNINFNIFLIIVHRFLIK
jgi:hypothetical protein